jgi:DNA polymerase III alpha subunit (gram-positive type)
LKTLIEGLLSPKFLVENENLKKSKTGKEFCDFFYEIFESFQSPDLPKKYSTVAETTEKHLVKVTNEAMNVYLTALDSTKFISKENLNKTHEKAKEIAILWFRNQKKISKKSEIQKAEEKLQNEIESYFFNRLTISAYLTLSLSSLLAFSSSLSLSLPSK